MRFIIARSKNKATSCSRYLKVIKFTTSHQDNLNSSAFTDPMCKSDIFKKQNIDIKKNALEPIRKLSLNSLEKRAASW